MISACSRSGTWLPVEFTTDHAARVVRLRAIPRLTLEEGGAAIDKIVANGLWGYGVLADARLTALTPDESEAMVEHLAEFSEAHGPSGPFAIVVRRADTVAPAEAFARRAKARGWQARTFFDLSDAEAWIQLQLRESRRP